jgi:hypothetical protein
MRELGKFPKELFFKFGSDIEEKIKVKFRELPEDDKEHLRLQELMFELPEFTGDLKRDQEIVAKLHDLTLEGLNLEEKITMDFLEVIRIQKQALLNQEKQDGTKKAVHPRWEREMILYKDWKIEQLHRSWMREMDELIEKLTTGNY